MRLADFITAASKQIISEWAEFARTCIPAASDLNLVQRRDHIVPVSTWTGTQGPGNSTQVDWQSYVRNISTQATP